MKITRRKLRQLIIEAARTFIVNPEGVASPADQVFKSGRKKDAAMARLHPKLGSLMDLDTEGGTSAGDDMRSERIMGRVIADTIPLEDESMRPERLTPAEETAVDQLGYDSLTKDNSPPELTSNVININSDNFSAAHFVVLSKNKLYLDALEKSYDYSHGGDLFYIIGEMTWMTPADDYEGMGVNFRAYAKILGCDVEDIGMVPMEADSANPLFDALQDYFSDNAVFEEHFENGVGNFFSIKVGDKKFILENEWGFRTYYFCAR